MHFGAECVKQRTTSLWTRHNHDYAVFTRGNIALITHTHTQMKKKIKHICSFISLYEDTFIKLKHRLNTFIATSLKRHCCSCPHNLGKTERSQSWFTSWSIEAAGGGCRNTQSLVVLNAPIMRTLYCLLVL